MNACTCRAAVAGTLIAVLLPLSAAHAQLGNLLQQGGSNGSTSGLGSLGNMESALAGKSVTSGSTSNVAGLLEFCIKNDYLSGSGASSVKDSLMSKIPGGSSSTDTGYTQGVKGILSSSNGQHLDLNGSGLKEQVAKQVCDKILAQGKSLL